MTDFVELASTLYIQVPGGALFGRVILWRGGGGAQSLPLTHSCPNAPRSPNAALTNAEILARSYIVGPDTTALLRS